MQLLFQAVVLVAVLGCVTSKVNEKWRKDVRKFENESIIRDCNRYLEESVLYLIGKSKAKPTMTLPVDVAVYVQFVLKLSGETMTITPVHVFYHSTSPSEVSEIQPMSAEIHRHTRDDFKDYAEECKDKPDIKIMKFPDLDSEVHDLAIIPRDVLLRTLKIASEPAVKPVLIYDEAYTYSEGIGITLYQNFAFIFMESDNLKIDISNRPDLADLQKVDWSTPPPSPPSLDTSQGTEKTKSGWWPTAETQAQVWNGLGSVASSVLGWRGTTATPVVAH